MVVILLPKRKASAYNHLIQFYKQGEPSYDENWQLVEGSPVPYKKVWCMVESVFREQLEAYINGVTINRNRVQLTMRYRNDIDSTMSFDLNGRRYNVGLVGDKKGKSLETQVLGEVSEDGGV